MTVSKNHQRILTKNDVLAGRGDLSPFLVHLTRDGKVRLWADIYKNLEQNDEKILKAKSCLEKIIKSQSINAISPFGYFQYKVAWHAASGYTKNENSKIQRTWLQSVCFTETPIDHVHYQMRRIAGRNLEFQPYGLAFWEKSIRAKGGNPIFYFDSNNQPIKNSLDNLAISPECEQHKSLLPLYESFGPRLYGDKGEIDFRWEREWRVPGHVQFSYKDVAFGICDANDIDYFETMVRNQFPFVDPRSDMKLVKNKLRQRLPGVKI